MKKIDTLIVGQGIAGSLVAFMLHRRGITFKVIDPGNKNTCSRIAAGMFTPVSGKRNALQPMASVQIPFAVSVYQEMEILLGVKMLHLCNIYEVFNSMIAQKQLTVNIKDTDFNRYICITPLPLAGIDSRNGAFEITHSGWVDCALMIDSFAGWLYNEGALLKNDFLHNALEINDGLMSYQGTEFRYIIFCEGSQAIKNPFFSNENIIPCKGDILTIECRQEGIDRIVKKDGFYLIPLGGGLFRAGATYQWNNDTLLPDDLNRKLIESSLDSILDKPHTVLEHKAGIRPTTKDRQTVATQHPVNKGMFMLNGLGTKGILNGPWWANQLVELIFGH